MLPKSVQFKGFARCAFHTKSVQGLHFELKCACYAFCTQILQGTNFEPKLFRACILHQRCALYRYCRKMFSVGTLHSQYASGQVENLSPNICRASNLQQKYASILCQVCTLQQRVNCRASKMHPKCTGHAFCAKVCRTSIVRKTMSRHGVCKKMCQVVQCILIQHVHVLYFGEIVAMTAFNTKSEQGMQLASKVCTCKI